MNLYRTMYDHWWSPMIIIYNRGFDLSCKDQYHHHESPQKKSAEKRNFVYRTNNRSEM